MTFKPAPPWMLLDLERFALSLPAGQLVACNRSKDMRIDVYTQVTDRIIADLEPCEPRPLGPTKSVNSSP